MNATSTPDVWQWSTPRLKQADQVTHDLVVELVSSLSVQLLNTVK